MRKGIKKVLTIIMFLILIGLIIFNLYMMYNNIEISTDYEVTKTSTLASNQIVADEEKNEISVENMLENVTKSVVGISRLTNAGGSILNNVSSEELGLGTGVIVSEDGYILSNSHVTGEKFSTCYVTIDENTYKGTVVWGDSTLDLSIVKVQMNNLTYINLGDSSNTKVGERYMQ